MHFAVQKDVFLTLKYGKTRWRPGLRPADPAGGAYDDPPDHLVGWGGDTPPQIPPRSAPSALRFSRLWHSIHILGASNFTSSALNFGVPIVVNLRNDHWVLPITPYKGSFRAFFAVCIVLCVTKKTDRLIE